MVFNLFNLFNDRRVPRSSKKEIDLSLLGKLSRNSHNLDDLPRHCGQTADSIKTGLGLCRLRVYGNGVRLLHLPDEVLCGLNEAMTKEVNYKSAIFGALASFQAVSFTLFAFFYFKTALKIKLTIERVPL